MTYTLGPDSIRQKHAPRGTVTKYKWNKSQSHFGQMSRDYWLYIPDQYDPETPAGLMVFQDGHQYVDAEGQFRVPIVFDNLIYQQRIPILIGLFVNPGHSGTNPPATPWEADGRMLEYDSLTTFYAQFLIEEMIPEVEKAYHLADDPKMRAICGLSSGGICAFTAAWQRPDYFHKVMSHIGSFVNIFGGHNYPSLIRTSTKRDIRVFLQAGSNDNDHPIGNWWLCNLQMESALKYRNYDYKFEGGTGGHDGEHGGAIFPESLVWLWR